MEPPTNLDGDDEYAKRRPRRRAVLAEEGEIDLSVPHVQDEEEIDLSTVMQQVIQGKEEEIEIAFDASSTSHQGEEEIDLSAPMIGARLQRRRN